MKPKRRPLSQEIRDSGLRFFDSGTQGENLNDPKAPSDWLKVDGIDALVELALNLHWSWNHAADELWEGLDKELWATTQNPWVILRTVSHEKIKAALGSSEFRRRLDSLLQQNRESYQADAWFQHKHPDAALSTIAYFSMEFMLSEALPIYSGGLGNVAGDQMKAASDLGVPVVGVGLLYGQGYFRQDFDSDGRQQALYPVNDPGQRPDRQLPRIVDWIECLLSPIRIEVLAEIPLAVEQADPDYWNTKVARRLHLVAGHVAKPSRIDGQRFAQHELHAEVCDRGQCGVGMFLLEPRVGPIGFPILLKQTVETTAELR